MWGCKMNDLEIKIRLEQMYQQSDKTMSIEGIPSALGELRANINKLICNIMAEQPTPETLTNTNNPYME